jgi:hypothetical protein
MMEAIIRTTYGEPREDFTRKLKTNLNNSNNHASLSIR